MGSVGKGHSKERWAQVQQLFDSLVDLPAEERTDRLGESRSTDPDLAQTVEVLLAAHDRADEVLDDLEHPRLPSPQSPAGGREDVTDPYRLVGRTVSHYRVLETLGDGGMGVVYLAEDERLGRPVALKFLPPHCSRSPEAKQRFTREARAASALDHPNIGSVYEIADHEDGSLYIAMAYYPGASLQKRIDGGPLPVADALAIAIQIARGLAAVHRKGIVHRDIKPGNVAVSADGIAKILDFGLAKIADTTLTRTGQMMGTAAYMSPEQARAGSVDARTDLWSLGVVLYEMITGQRPFQGGRQPSVVHSILHEEPPAPATLRPEVPASLERVVLKLLRKDPQARYPDAEALLVDLEALRESREPPVMTREWRQAASATRRRRAVGAVVVLSILAAGVWGASRLASAAQNRSETTTFAGAVAGNPSDAQPTIAVLPFENLSEDTADSYFTDGVHEEVLTRLARITALKVIARTSVLAYREHPAAVRTIADALGADYVVEGSVRRSPDRVVVSAKLIDASTDSYIWSDSYERERRDLFTIQAEIAGRIADALRTRLSSEERALIAARPTENIEAHDLYLQSGAVFSRTRPDSAIALLERALRLDPTFALAYVALSSIHRQLYFWNEDPSDARLALAKDAAERALALAPDLPEAHRALGRYYYAARDYTLALEQFEIARRGLPNESPLHVDLGYIYRRQGRFKEAAASFQAALERSPSSFVAAYHLAGTLALLGDYEEGETHFRRLMAGYPNDAGARVMLATLVYTWGMGRPDRARALLHEVAGLSNANFAFDWMQVFLTERNFDEALGFLEGQDWDAIRMETQYWPRTLFLARVHQWLGHGERALAYFDSARVMLDSELLTFPRDSRMMAALAHALAGLGEKDEAVRAARRATELMPVSTDAVDGAFRLQDLADVYANVGEPEKALVTLDFLLTSPGPFSVQHLRLRPEWDPLRDHPDYAALLERHGG